MPRANRWSLGALLALVLTMVWPATTQAQLCFRGHPAPRCAGFAILEFTGGARFNPAERPIDPGFSQPNRVFMSWSAGYLHNLGGRAAIGATFKVTADDDGHRYGPVLRYRRWLGPTWSVEFAPGMMVGGQDNFAKRWFPSAMLDLGINWGDRIGLELGLEGVRREGGGSSSWDGHIGIRLGTWLAPLATLALGIMAGATYN